MQMCQPYILRAIELCRPKFILCLGGHPAQRLSGKSDGLLSLRGKWFDLAIGRHEDSGAGKFPSELPAEAAGAKAPGLARSALV